MILVEWKGDDERPFRLSFHPHFTLVHVPDESRNRLVQEIAAAFEASLAKLGSTPEEPLNVITHKDLEWILEGSQSSDEIEIQPDFNPVELEHRRLAAQDAFAEAEARLEKTVSEVRAQKDELLLHDESSPRAQVIRLRKILNWRIESLETALSRPTVSITNVRGLLEEAKDEELWELHETWEANYAKVAEALAPQKDKEVRPRPPAWLIEQSQRELALAEAALEVFAAQQGAHTPSFLEREARRRYGDAMEVWEELQPYLDVEQSAAPASIAFILRELEELSGKQAYGAEEALAIIGQCLFDIRKSFGISEQLRLALEQAGTFLSPSADYFAEARQWVAAREGEWAQREAKRAELAAFKADLAGVDAMEKQLQDAPENSIEEDSLILAARQEFEAAKAAYEAELAAIEQAGIDMVRSTYKQSEPQLGAGQRLANIISEFQTAVEDEVPLIINAAFDDLTETQREELFATLVAAASSQQIIYFTQNEELMKWASTQDDSIVSLCTVAA